PDMLIDKVLGIDPGLEENIPFLLHVYSFSAQSYPLPEGIQGEQLSRAIRMSFGRLVAALAREKTLILLLDDWQWADGASDSMLKYLVRFSSGHGVLMLVNYRADHHPDWGNHVHHTHLTLPPLQDRQTLRVIKHMLGVKYVPGALSRLILARTDGNPFFVEETCRSLMEHGTVTRKNVREADINQGTEELKLPETVQAVIRSRLDRLEREVQEVLTLASVIGGQFSGAILERLYPNTEALYRHIGRLQDLEIVEQVQFVPDPVFRFRQILFQEVAYTGQLLQKSKALHLGVAEAMESLYGDNLTLHHGQLGRHLFAAEVWEKSVMLLRAAANRAGSLSAYQEAGELLEQALEAVEHMPPNENREGLGIDLRLELRHVLFPQRQFKKIDGLLETSRQAAFRLDDLLRSGQVLTYQMMAFLGTGRYREALKTGSEALGIANRINDGAMRKDILFQVVQAFVSQGDFSQAVSNALKLIDESEQSAASGTSPNGESIHTTLARTWVVWLLAELGEFEEARTRLGEYISRFEGNGNALHDVLLRLAKGLLSLRQGSYEAAVETLEPALAVDVNGNGVRDSGEPLIINMIEPFEDVGIDGLALAGGDVEEEGVLSGVDRFGDELHRLGGAGRQVLLLGVDAEEVSHGLRR
ncbi:MAG: hypothetical protein IIA23_05230, partial [Chloroflexi bacterium]|nr:hypothetical protein [Chloroflexota bacterium]